MDRRIRTVQAMKRAGIVSPIHNCLCVEFRSPLFQVVDDLEVVLDDAVRLIHLRSG